MWDVTVGGHVDSGEFGRQALIRETKEELGIEISDDIFVINKNNYIGKSTNLEIESSQQAAKHQMIKDYINTLKKQNKPLIKFDGLMWGSLLESATIIDKDTIVFKFQDGTEING